MGLPGVLHRAAAPAAGLTPPASLPTATLLRSYPPFPASARAERSPARAAQRCCAGMCHPQSEQMPFLTQQMANPTAGRGSGVPINIPSYRLNSAPPFSGLGASTGLPGSPRLQTSPRTPLGAGDQPLPPAPSPPRPSPSATAPGGSNELKQKRTLILKKIITLE